MRNRYRSGKINREEYEAFVDAKIGEVIHLQEEIGLDVLVHGEFERTDMVDFFAEQMDGMLVTGNGWVQSYGTRCVRPPLIYGDVSRSKPMTVRESRLPSRSRRSGEGDADRARHDPQLVLRARRPVPQESPMQIALALRDETTDLEAAGIRIIQIDEPAFREGLPLRGSRRVLPRVGGARLPSRLFGSEARHAGPHAHVLQRLQRDHRFDRRDGCRCDLDRELTQRRRAAPCIRSLRVPARDRPGRLRCPQRAGPPGGGDDDLRRRVACCRAIFSG